MRNKIVIKDRNTVERTKGGVERVKPTENVRPSSPPPAPKPRK
jgi:hypothetical protein